jgi:SAM-dependent methyltransferase
MSELLLGCGTDRRKKVRFECIPSDWTDLTTLDMDEGVKPNVVWVLDSPYPLPFTDNSFDEIHAYEVLEHCGKQGDWRFFFRQFHDFWRMLKPGGYFVATVPMWDSPWSWGDPGHRRVIPKESLIFLNRGEYSQLGETAMTDYREAWKGNFETIAVHETEHQMAFVLKAIK